MLEPCCPCWQSRWGHVVSRRSPSHASAAPWHMALPALPLQAYSLARGWLACSGGRAVGSAVAPTGMLATAAAHFSALAIGAASRIQGMASTLSIMLMLTTGAAICKYLTQVVEQRGCVGCGASIGCRAVACGRDLSSHGGMCQTSRSLHSATGWVMAWACSLRLAWLSVSDIQQTLAGTPQRLPLLGLQLIV